MAKKTNEAFALVLAFLVTGGLVGGGLWWLFRSGTIQSLQQEASKTASVGNIQERTSLGDRVLVLADTNDSKSAGVAAFARQDFSTAAKSFQASLQQNRNDPEALIYLNNARAARHQPLKIAVSVPVGSNLNVAKEILRGVAQAQDEVNSAGGINGAWLQVLITNDDNDPAIAQQVATRLVNDPNVLAVVGHNASNASAAAAPTYQQGKLLMITPTSFAKNVTEAGDYIFRIVPNIRFVANRLARYAVQTVRKTSFAVCFDSRAPDNQAFRDDFMAAVYEEGGKLVNIPCDFSAPDFNPSTVISQMISAGADALLLTPHVDRIEKAIEVARANRSRLSLYGSPTIYTIKTLESGSVDVNGLVLAVPWHPQALPNNPFPANARKRWGGDVSWRTASAYDAVLVLVRGLQQSPTRDGLQTILSSPSFSAQGATGSIEFLPSRDRNGSALLVRIEPKKGSLKGYDFVPIQP